VTLVPRGQHSGVENRHSFLNGGGEYALALSVLEFAGLRMRRAHFATGETQDGDDECIQAVLPLWVQLCGNSLSCLCWHEPGCIGITSAWTIQVG